MSLWSRIENAFRGDRLSREIDEEFESHVAEAIEQGRDPAEVRRAFGSPLRQREESRDVKLVTWLDSLRADIIFGWRQLLKRKVTSAAAILSLALGIGACTSAFRLIDALFLRPLPVADPQRLYSISFEKLNKQRQLETFDSCSYPLFRELRATVRDQAELIAISYSERRDLTYASDAEMEKAHWQFVFGWMFSSLGIRPALGRVLTENDDLKPGSSPVAVLTYGYWSSRFAGDPKVIGRTFRAGNDLYGIVGVSAKGFTGTETGTAIDILVPTMMEAGSINSANSFWIRTFVRPRPGAAIELLRQKLFATYQAREQEREKGFTNFPQSLLEASRTRMLLKSAAEGVSEMQKDYQRSLLALGVLVMLVLLIACANVANLMAAQAAARAREMALRVSIGAGRWRLVQLVLVESAFLAFLAAAIGMLFAWWSAPLVVRMINPPDNPAHLVLPADWRVIGFGLLLTLAVTLLFGLAPALRASGVKPISALKGGDDVRMRRPLMHALIAVQVAFCFLVLFVGGLFIATFQRLANLPAGFTAEGLLTLDTVAKSRQPTLLWNQVAQHLRTVPGVDSVALAAWPLMSGTMSNNFISINGAPPSDVLAFFLKVSPGWLDTMKILLIDGRDFRSADIDPSVAIVNQTFVKQYFSGQNPIGKSFEQTYPARTRLVIVGIAKDAGYRSVREPMLPVFYIPIESAGPRGDATILVRTSRPDPLLLATALRREVSRAHPEFRVSNIRTQVEINQAQTIRERLLAMLAFFFAAVALLLAGIGLYGVLDYSVLQRRREIGIRIAIGARPAGVARLVTVDVFAMVLVGAIGGLALGMASVRYIEPLFYDVKATDAGMLALPSLAILAAALLAAAPAVIHAVRIDPAETLRSE